MRFDVYIDGERQGPREVPAPGVPGEWVELDGEPLRIVAVRELELEGVRRPVLELEREADCTDADPGLLPWRGGC